MKKKEKSNVAPRISRERGKVPKTDATKNAPVKEVEVKEKVKKISKHFFIKEENAVKMETWCNILKNHDSWKDRYKNASALVDLLIEEEIKKVLANKEMVEYLQSKLL